MKKIIMQIAKRIGVNVTVDSEKEAFDIINYTVHVGSKQDTFQYFTGRTSTGVSYPFDKDVFVKNIEKFIINSQKP